MKCIKIPSNKTSHLTVKRDVATSDKIIKKNVDSQNCQENPVSDCGASVIQKQHAHNVEDSPELHYYPSPTLLPFTQDSGNEVAWDWQSSLNKTPESKSKKQNAYCETPKGTKWLQRKRNSNSPLLYEPLKRKTMNIEKNKDNFGQLTAELQAITERVRQNQKIKQNDKSHSEDNHVKEEDAVISANADNEQETSRIVSNEQNFIERIGNADKIMKNNTSGNYDDLFDDSVDESIIRCTQEMEEKFNLIADKENSIYSQADVEKKESPHANEAVQTCVKFTSNENSKKSPTKMILHEDKYDKNTLKTYSKLSLRRDANVSMPAAAQRDEDREIADKSHQDNNNSTTNSYMKFRNTKKLSKHDSTELFDFPDDSFDDCLATFVEDEKLSLLFNDTLPRRTKPDGAKFEASYKRSIHASLKPEAKSTNSLKSVVTVEASSSTFENRKFFKTKSLSDQCFGQPAQTHAKNRTILHINSTSNASSVVHTSVSKNPTVTNDRKVEGSAISLMRSMDHVHGSNVNRCAVKEGGDRFVRHYSTGNIKTDMKETMKTGSQMAKCTAEEIEKKRLQAVMRLEMKKKQLKQSMNVVNNINR